MADAFPEFTYPYLFNESNDFVLIVPKVVNVGRAGVEEEDVKVAFVGLDVMKEGVGLDYLEHQVLLLVSHVPYGRADTWDEFLPDEVEPKTIPEDLVEKVPVFEGRDPDQHL